MPDKIWVVYENDLGHKRALCAFANSDDAMEFKRERQAKNRMFYYQCESLTLHQESIVSV